MSSLANEVLLYFLGVVLFLCDCVKQHDTNMFKI